MPLSWGRCTSGPRLSGKEFQGFGAKAASAREAPSASCPPLCGSHLSGRWLQRARQPPARPPRLACTSHSPAPRHLRRRAQVRPSAPHATAAERAAPAAAPTRTREGPACILPDTPRPRAALSIPRHGEAETEAKPASRRGPSSSRRKARDGGADSLDRPLKPGRPRLAPDLARRSGHCSVRVRGCAGSRGLNALGAVHGGRGHRVAPSWPSSRQPTRQTKVSASAARRARATHSPGTRCPVGGGASRLPPLLGPSAPAAQAADRVGL